MNEKRDLDVPKEVNADPEAQEVLRVWIANNRLFCALLPTAWEDPLSWGILLADVARHVANAIQEDRGDLASVTLSNIRQMFNIELEDPTDTPTGSFRN